MPFLPRTDPQCDWQRGSHYNCPGDPIHVVGAKSPEGFVQLFLCHEHFLLAVERGLIEEPFVGEDEFRRQGGTP